MSNLVPGSGLANSIASVAQTTIRRIEPAVASLSDDGRNGTTARDGVGAGERRFKETTTRTVLPPPHGENSWRGPRRTRAQDIPSYWPTAAYFAQHLSQEALPDERPAVDHGTGASRYPSLTFDSDIILPGETLPSTSALRQRVDIVV